MNREKAREFFSAYYEGNLDAGLRQTFEQRLKADVELDREYQAFEEAMAQLDTLKFEEIEVPMFLSDRIATRIEQVQEQQRPKVAPWNLWLRGLAFSGLAAAAVFAAVVSMRGGNSNVGQAGLAPTVATEELTLSQKNEGLVLEYRANKSQEIKISSGGKELETVRLDAGRKLESPLRNANPGTALFEVQVDGSPAKTLIAVPGTSVVRSTSGDGTIAQFAEALAGHYRVPVQVTVNDPNKTVSWNFDSTDVFEAATAALEGYQVQRLDPVVRIQNR